MERLERRAVGDLRYALAIGMPSRAGQSRLNNVTLPYRIAV